MAGTLCKAIQINLKSIRLSSDRTSPMAHSLKLMPNNLIPKQKSNDRNQFNNTVVLEHRKKDIAEFATYYQPKTAEVLFDHAWRTMAELFPVFIEARFGPTWSIAEIQIEERDPKRQRRWRFVHCEPVERGNFTK